MARAFLPQLVYSNKNEMSNHVQQKICVFNLSETNEARMSPFSWKMLISDLFWQGNKGGVSIRLDISGVNICFVNCHLTAHRDELERRVQVSQTFVAASYLFLLLQFHHRLSGRRNTTGAFWFLQSSMMYHNILLHRAGFHCVGFNSVMFSCIITQYFTVYRIWKVFTWCFHLRELPRKQELVVDRGQLVSPFALYWWGRLSWCR